MRDAINIAGAPTAGPYSLAVRGGGLLVLSGQTPVDPDTGALVEGNVAVQTRQCFANLFAVLEEAKLGPSDVIAVQVFLTNMADFDAMNEVYVEHFAEPYPARTTIGVAQLPLGAQVEIALTAAG